MLSRSESKCSEGLLFTYLDNDPNGKHALEECFSKSEAYLATVGFLMYIFCIITHQNVRVSQRPC